MKLVSFGEINIGISFWALLIFVVIDIYVAKNINITEMWLLRDRVFKDMEGKHGNS